MVGNGKNKPLPDIVLNGVRYTFTFALCHTHRTTDRQTHMHTYTHTHTRARSFANFGRLFAVGMSSV